MRVRAGAGGNKHEPTGASGVLELDLGSLAHTKTMKEASKDLEWNNQKISKNATGKLNLYKKVHKELHNTIEMRLSVGRI